MTDSLSGETVAYQYDALKRLTSAASTPNAGITPTAWTETYGYDGFGNLTSKVLNGTTAAIGVTTVSTNGESGSQLELTRAVCTGRVDQTVHDAWRTVQRFLSELPRDKAKAMRLLGFAWLANQIGWLRG